MNSARYLSLLPALTLIACEATAPVTRSVETTPTAAPRALGIDLNNMDKTVSPADDFFEYVNGNWLISKEIPADKSNYGAFTELFDAAEENLRLIIEEAAASDAAAGTPMQKVGDLYRSFMDVERIEELGLAPLAAELQRIDAIADVGDLAHWFGHGLSIGVPGPVVFWVNQDARNTTEYISYFNQAGLGLPDRDYYFDDGERFVAIRDAYRDYVETILALSDHRDPAGAAQAIFDLEKRIASHHWTRVQNRDRDRTYNKYNSAEVQTLTQGLPWPRLLEGAGIGAIDAAIIRQPDYFDALGDIVAEVPLATWKNYLRYRLLSSFAPALPEAFVEANFDFYGRTLTGTEQIRERWKRGVQRVEGVLGEALGQIYVERHFRPEAKARMDELVANLSEAFAQAIDELEWMSPQTREQARQKLSKFTAKIGYPDKWRDYSRLQVQPDQLVANLMASARFDHEYTVNKLGKPIDRDEWFMTPQTVNAYYNPSMNEIVFPAAILQPPFFNVDADDAVNYGAIGAVIGHEFSHGFDDQGRKSDGDGMLRDWWTEDDAAEFSRRAAGLVEQYNGFSPLEDMNVNGELTLGENIGDLAGLTMAYRAYKLSLDGQPGPVIAGFSADQRFFMGWAQVWRRKYREDELRRRLLTDPHSPSRYRVNGIVRNMDAFYTAFDVQPGDELYLPPAQRVAIW